MLALVGVSAPQINGQISSEDHVRLILKVFSIYAVHLGVIVGAVLGQQRKATRRASDSPVLRSAVIGLLLLWNLLVLYRIAIYDFMPPTDRSYEDLIRYLEAIPRESVFLIAGVLAFLSARSREEV